MTDEVPFWILPVLRYALENGWKLSVNSDAEPSDEQERAVGILNDRFGVDRWDMLSNGTMQVTLDDGDVAIVTQAGSWKIT